jgi:DNA polymerase-3 subunit delta
MAIQNKTAYLYLGPEIGEREDAVSAIRARMRETHSNVEETSFYAGDTQTGEIVTLIQNGSLFADARLFIIKNAEEIKKKEAKELLSPCLMKLPEKTTVILISLSTKIEKELEDCVPKNNKTIFWEMFEDRKIDWVRNFWRRAGYNINNDAVEMILEMVENNTEALRRECSALMLFLDKTQVIDGAAIEKWLARTRSESAFTLFSAIAAGSLSKSADILHALLGAKESPVALFAGLTWCFKRLRDYTAVVESGNSNDFEFRKIGLASPLIRKDYVLMHKNYAQVSNVADICLSLTAEMDVMIREGGGALESILMDYYLFKIISLSKNGGNV